MKVLAFGASSSTKSINKQFATYAASLIPNAEVQIIDLNDYKLPIFSEDQEKETPKPDSVIKFLNKISESDLLVISLAEHNGAYTAVYKNLIDWCSRVDREFFNNKPLVLLSTSPGARGASSALEFAKNSAKYFAGNVVASFSLPSFYDNFDIENQRLSNEDVLKELQEILKTALS